ncbi:MAG: hypothetical protein MZV63_45865 [Marinilabiliales bacterium]|nr:hypothetical protein [Marinilabiliales bacterium]
MKNNFRISNSTWPYPNLFLKITGQDYTGFIHKVLLDNYLCRHDEPEDIEYYFCGPPQMNNAVVKMLDSLGVPQENIAFDDFGI